MPMADIDSKRPTAITILGKQLVVWKDSSGDCHVFEDKCPHRLVALSEGRIEGDELMCAYHGWRFDGAPPTSAHSPRTRPPGAGILSDTCVSISPCTASHERDAGAHSARAPAGAGACTKIPQLFTQGGATKAKILQAPAACAQAFPVAATAGLLWVWMSDSKNAHAEALQCASPLFRSQGSKAQRMSPLSWPA